MKKVLFFLYNQSAEFEITVLATALKSAGCDVVTCSLSGTSEPVTTVSGFRMLAHLAVEDVNPADFDALVIPGGVCHPYFGEESLMRMIRDFHAQDKVLGAICAGPSFLAAAGVLGDSVTYTTSLDLHNLEYADVMNWRNKREEFVVTDGKIVTATGSNYVYFAEAVLRALGLDDDLTYFRERSMQ